MVFSGDSFLCGIYFTLTSAGTVVLRRALDYESLQDLQCHVVAKDRGSPTLTSTTTLTFTASVVDVEEEETEVEDSDGSASVFVSLEVPFDSSKGKWFHTLNASLFGVEEQGASATVTFLSLQGDGVFAVAKETGEVTVAREDLLYDQSRYFQWVACRWDGPGEETGTQLGLIRVDAFSMDRHVVVISYGVGAEELETVR